jgi:hypothetical protein
VPLVSEYEDALSRQTWKGDHSPRHVHVYRDGKLVLKWNLEAGVPMKGKATARLVRLILELDKKGAL